MRVLFYEGPVTDCHNMLWRAPHISLDAVMYHALPNANRRMVLNEHFAFAAELEGIKRADLITVDEKYFLDLLDHPQDNVNSLFQYYSDVLEGRTPPTGNYREQLAITYCERYQQAVERLLGDFIPDVIITWLPSAFLRRLFPHALILHRESGMFTRAPFPMTYYLDPCGLHQWSWPSQFSEQARNATPETTTQIDRLRQYYGVLLAATDPFASLRATLSEFRNIILVSTQVSGHFAFSSTSGYRSQMHKLRDVLRHTPPDCAVVVGQHPSAIPLRHDEIAWLQERFSNFIHRPHFTGIENISQYLLMHADAMATVSSTLGWQSVFWGKPLIALGHSQLNGFAQAESATAIPALLDAPAPDTRAASAWLAFHYCIPASLFEQPGWLETYLAERLVHWRMHGVKGYYDKPYAPPEYIADNFIRETDARMENLLGTPLGSSAHEEAINFADKQRFGDGWSFCEGAGSNTYRWIDGKKAILRLVLPAQQSYNIAMLLGTHEACAAQKVTIGIGSTTLASADVSSKKHAELRFTIPDHLIEKPFTALWVCADAAVAPAGDPRMLSLICQRITVKKSTSMLQKAAS